MKRYINPSMTIALFSNEEVATTASAADMQAIQEWEEGITNNYSTDSRIVDFAKTIEFTF